MGGMAICDTSMLPIRNKSINFSCSEIRQMSRARQIELKLSKLKDTAFNFNARKYLSAYHIDNLLNHLFGKTNATVYHFSKEDANKLDKDEAIILYKKYAINIPACFSDCGGIALFSYIPNIRDLKKEIERVLNYKLTDNSIIVFASPNPVIVAHELTHIKQHGSKLIETYNNGYRSSSLEKEAFLNSMIVFRAVHPNASFFDFVRYQDNKSLDNLPDQKIFLLLIDKSTHLNIEHEMWNKLNGGILMEEIKAGWKDNKPQEKERKKAVGPAKTKENISQDDALHSNKVALIYEYANKNIPSNKIIFFKIALIAYLNEWKTFLPYIKDEKSFKLCLEDGYRVAKKILSPKEFASLIKNPLQYLEGK